jgi:hypothetical protein
VSLVCHHEAQRYYSRNEGERAPLIGAEVDGLHGMIFDEGEDAANSDNDGRDEGAVQGWN